MLVYTIAKFTQTFIPNIANTLLINCLIFSIPIVKRQNKLLKLLMLISLIIILNYIRVYQGLTISALTRGIWGDLSLTSLFTLLFIVLGQVDLIKFKKELINLPSSIIIVCIASMLYLSTFAIISNDLYFYGYYPGFAFMLVFVIVELLLYMYSQLYAIVWLIAAIAFYYHLQTSSNLWDYLLDPVLFIINLLLIIKKLFKR